MDLTIRWVDKVKSGRLARVLIRILVKLVRALESRMVRAMGSGRVLALRLSEMAVAWGSMSAYRWRFDASFQKALGMGVVFG